jgi:hypothetical protein
MPLSRQTLEKRAVKAGVKASVKLGHVISEQELLALRVQTMSTIWRTLLILAGIALIASCWFAWPYPSIVARVLEAISGVFSLLFGIFGIRRTLGQLFETLDVADLAGTVLDGILEMISL